MDLPFKCNETLSTGDEDCEISEPRQGLCPSGWHIPTIDEWGVLTDFAGSDEGKKLKAKDGWESDGNGTDGYGFTALPGGCGSDGSFGDVGYFGSWWSATEGNADNANTWYVGYYYSGVLEYDGKSNLYSVRCVQDSP
jgi:uncharacterized protein (TIGR02145 family)